MKKKLCLYLFVVLSATLLSQSSDLTTYYQAIKGTPTTKLAFFSFKQTFSAPSLMQRAEWWLTKRIKSAAKYLVGKQHDKTVQVREDRRLSAGELDYLAKRDTKTKTAIENLLDIKISGRPPRIALCFSGGGYRALLAAIGFLLAAQETGLLDASTYIASLSGSTWAIAQWMALEYSPENLKRTAIEKITSSPTSPALNAKLLAKLFMTRLLFDQPLNSVDILGTIMGNKYLQEFGDRRFKVGLSETQKAIQNADKPFPIYTAVATPATHLAPEAKEDLGTYLASWILAQKSKYAWVEFTPFEIGSEELGAFIPTKTLGWGFEGGKSTSSAPPLGLAYLMAIWGSAYTANMKEIVQTIKNMISPKALVKFLEDIASTRMGEVRFYPAEMANFTYGMPKSPMKNDERLFLVDAGVSVNVPLLPLFRAEREVDLVIVCDASETVQKNPGEQLNKFSDYAKQRGIKTPRIGTAKNQLVNIFPGAEGVPTIVHLPLTKNENFSRTYNPDPLEHKDLSSFNMWYSKDQASNVVGVMRQNLMDSMPFIVGAIQEKL